MSRSLSPLQDMPAGYAEKLRQARSRRAMHGERRVITMLFCDVTGSTSMAEQLDPEEWAEIMNEAFEFMISPVYRYEGTVARLLGDAILAFFGAPIGHEDDPQRAILAGLEIVAGIKPFCRDIKQEYGLDFNVRVGINTGPVVVGDVGSDLAIEYTAMGDAINLASRMESTAEPGTVQISEHTYRLIAPLFDVKDRGLLTVRGKAEPVHAYQVLGLKSEPGSLRGIQGVETPLIGRSAELTQLKQIVDELVHEGKGRIVFLVGEAGLGKSRLIDELCAEWHARRSAIEDDWDHWARMDAVSYGSSQPYGMVKHVLRSRYGIRETDAPYLIRAKLAEAVLFYPERVQQRMLQLFAILLGAAEQHDVLRPEGEAFKRELFDLMLEATEIQIGTAPTVYVADDLHWGDPVSIEEIETLFPLAETHPVLLLAAMRPERHSAAWRAKEEVAAQYPNQFVEIVFDPLGIDESASLVDSLLPVADLPGELRQVILQKAEGNPFFIEEVVRTLMDSGAIVRQHGDFQWTSTAEGADFAVPESVQALLVSRIDRLEKELKWTLQLASVIGRTFYERVLENISESADALDQQLDTLEEVGMITEAARLPELAYAFRHALTRDAAYRTILRRRRRQFHRQVGEAIETLFPDRLEEEAQRLAHHFREGRQLDKALTYYTMAADQASRLYANVEAGELYTHAIALARRVGGNEQLITLFKRRGRLYEVGGLYEEAMANYNEMDLLTEERDDQEFRLQSLLGKATILATYTDLFDPEQGREIIEQALGLALSLGNYSAQARAYWNLMLLETYVGAEPAQIVALGEKAVAVARQHNLREELAYALHDLARPYTLVSRLTDAQSVLEEAGQLWREMGNMPMLADNLATQAVGYSYQGQLVRATEFSEEAYRISCAVGNYWGQAYALVTLAPVYMERGQFQRAVKAWQDALPAAEKANFAGPQIFARINLAMACGFLGDIEQGRAVIEEAIVKARELEQEPILKLALLARARLNLYVGRDEEARALLAEPVERAELIRVEAVAYTLHLVVAGLVGLAAKRYEHVLAKTEEGIDFFGHMGIKLSLLELRQLKAQALLGLDRPLEAEATLLKARSDAIAYGARKTLLSILISLKRVEEVLGKRTEATAILQETRQLIDELAGNIDMDAQRELFLNSPLLRDSLSAS